jgi:MFS transporter, DHA3 family, macrolide efflux protein
VPRPALRGFTVFLIIWVGQFISQLGSGLTTFALGVWVYLQTGSVGQFAIVYLAGTVPATLIFPLAGALVDRWNRRSVMIGCNLALAINTLALIGLFSSHRLEIWHTYVAVAFASLVNAFNGPAYSTIIPLLVEKKHFGRANGMMQGAQGMAQLIAPVVAGILVVTIKVQGVLVIDCATFVFAFITLVIVRIPLISDSAQKAATGRSLLQETAYGWSYIVSRAGLFGLMMFLAFSNFLTGIIEVLAQPLVLSFASPAALGRALSIGGSGLLVGSVVMSIWGAPKRRVLGILGLHLLMSLGLVCIGWRPSLVLVTSAAFVIFFCLAIINGSIRTLMNSKVEVGAQARVIAMSLMMTSISQPLGYLLAGPLADKVFGPLLAFNGPLAGSVGRILGTGPGRGIALMFVIAGMLAVAVTIAGYLYRPLRMLETDLPDIPDDKFVASHENRKDDPGQSALVPNNDVRTYSAAEVKAFAPRSH